MKTSRGTLKFDGGCLWEVGIYTGGGGEGLHFTF